MPRQSDLLYTVKPLWGDPFEVVSFTLDVTLQQGMSLEGLVLDWLDNGEPA